MIFVEVVELAVGAVAVMHAAEFEIAALSKAVS